MGNNKIPANRPSGNLLHPPRWALLLLLLLFIPGLGWGGQQKELRINITSDAPYFTPEGDGLLDVLLKEISRRSGVKFFLNNYKGAAARSLVVSNSGQADGEVGRTKGVVREFPNLRVVPEPILKLNFSAFSIRHNFRSDRWASLKPYEVGYLNGWKMYQKNVTGTKGAFPVNTPGQMFKMLQLGRLDVVLYEESLGLYYLRKQGIKGRVLQPPLASVDLFMLLHKKHNNLLAPISNALREIKKDGTYKRMRDDILTVGRP